MNLASLTLYLLSLISVVVIWRLSYDIYRRFQLPFLLHYLYFISAFFAAGFIDLVGGHLLAMMLGEQEPHTIMLLEHIFVFLAFPFIPIAIYFFIRFMMGFLSKKVTARFRYIYGAIWVLLFLLIVIATKTFLSTRDAGMSRYLFAILDNTPYVFYLLVLVTGLILSRDIDETNRTRGVRIFCVLGLTGFTLSWFLSRSLTGSLSGPQPLHIFLYFALNLPSFLYLRHHLERFPPEPASAPLMQEDDLERFYESFELSRREREIVRLMLTGKSNKEIAGELFVSVHTVKNHVYNIYQKLQVSSRLHFIRVVQRFIRGRTE